MIELPALFSDRMVMQQGAPVPFWGRCTPRAHISLAFLHKTYSARGDDAGEWMITLEPAAPGGPFTLAISLPEYAETLMLSDLYVGEVWLCSGQSNMELSMARLKDAYPGEFNLPSYPPVRQYRLPYSGDFSGPQTRIPEARWTTASSESLADFSATAWFFARRMRERHPLPMGLIIAAVGGAPVEALMSREALRDYPDKLAQGEQYADPVLRGEAVARSDQRVRDWQDLLTQGDAGLRGAWFQGELDDRSWETLTLPGDFSEEPKLAEFCGALWLRRTVILPPGVEGRDARLWLGTIVDAETVYVNGREAGSTGYRYPPRKYALPPDLLHQGENQITLRVVCNDGKGGVTQGKPFHLFLGKPGAGAPIIPLEGRWKYRIGFKTFPRPAEFPILWQPTGLFNGMIAPLLPTAFRGILWYQGESNDKRPEDYGALFLRLIEDWRNKKQQRDLPFLFVQLPIYGNPEENREQSPWAVLREAQANALQIPGTGMAAALDLGEWNDLHPLNKKDLGYRLALAADQVVYGADNTAPGPLVGELRCHEAVLFLSFTNCGLGLQVKDEMGGPPSESPAFVTVIGADGKAVRLPVQIQQPDTLRVDIRGVCNPRYIMYAWADNPLDRQLYNRDGLPMIPFRRVIPRDGG